MSNFAGFHQVGEFVPQRRIMRGVKNPLDQASIISIYPRTFEEIKPTLFPGKFIIEGGSIKSPAVTVIAASGYIRDEGAEKPLSEYNVSATELASSIIVDYCNGMLGCNMGSAMPGLFFVPGKIPVEVVVEQFQAQLAEMEAKQRNWYSALVKLADALWARSNNNPLVIWDEMRFAALELGLENKPWIKDAQAFEMLKCFACGGLKDPLYPVCPTCKVIDKTHPMAGDLQFAK